MSDPAFDRAIAITLKNEGGFQRSPNDPGNWTTGEAGSGFLKGTNFGISAAAYPHLDIRGLTIDKAKAIYFSDYYMKHRINDLPDPPLAKVFDMTVLMGPGGRSHDGAIRLLQWVLDDLAGPVDCDGVIGPETVQACKAIAPEALMSAYRLRLGQHARDIVQAHPYEAEDLDGWLRRIAQ